MTKEREIDAHFLFSVPAIPHSTPALCTQGKQYLCSSGFRDGSDELIYVCFTMVVDHIHFVAFQNRTA